MEDSPSRNAALYPWYVACLNGFYWFPVFFLYLSDTVGIAGALRLESIYYIAVVLFEVPSGWASDRLGRRFALRTAMLLLCLAYAAFLLGGSFLTLAVAQILLAAGYAFNSGTDTAFHYDSLTAAGRQHEFADREERIARLSFAMVALSALIGGVVATQGLRWAYGLSLLSALFGLGISLSFTRPEPADATTADRFDRQVVACLRYLKDPTLAWIFGFIVLLTVLIHIPYQIYQPYIALVDLRGLSLDSFPTPLVTGAHAAVAMLVAAWLSGHSVQWSRRFGLRRTALVGLAALVAIIATAGIALHPLVVVLLLFRSAPRALTLAPMNAVVTPRVPRQLRASYLSLQSLAGRLSFSGLLLAVSLLASTRDPTWSDISLICLMTAAIGATGWLVLAITSRRLEPEVRLGSGPPER